MRISIPLTVDVLNCLPQYVKEQAAQQIMRKADRELRKIEQMQEYLLQQRGLVMDLHGIARGIVDQKSMDDEVKKVSDYTRGYSFGKR